VLHHSCSLLWLLLLFFDVLGYSLNWFFTLIALDIKGNAVPMQTGVRLFGLVKQITSSQSICVRVDRSLLLVSKF